MKHYQRTILTVLCLLATAVTSQAQPDSVWSRFYGGTGNEYFQSMQPQIMGYVFGGATNTWGNGGYDMWLVRTNGNTHDTIWTAAFGGSADEYGRAAGQTQDAGFFIAGYTYSFGAGGSDFYLVKTDESGNMLWSRTYGGGGDENLYSAIATTDGGYLLVGETTTFASPGYDYWILKVNSVGDSVWSHTYGGTADAGATCVVETHDNDYVFCGVNRPNDGTIGDYWLIRVDSDGNDVWNQYYGRAWDDLPWSMCETEDHGFLITGQSLRADNSMDILTVRTNEFGDSLSSLVYGEEFADEIGHSVIETADGGFVVAGYSSRSIGSMLLVKGNTSGELTWAEALGGPDNDIGFDILQLNDGSFLVAGGSYSFGAGGADAWLLKTGPDPTAVDDHPVVMPESFALSCFPNPFNPTTTMSFVLTKSGHVTLRVYDVLGSEVESLVSERMEAGAHHVSFDGSRLASGVYFARLEQGERIVSTKLVLLK